MDLWKTFDWISSEADSPGIFSTTRVPPRRSRATRARARGGGAPGIVAGMADGSVRTSGGREFKPSVRVSYEGSLARHVLPVLGRTRVSDLARADLAALVKSMTRQGLSPSTTRNALMPLRVIVREAMTAGQLAVSSFPGLVLPGRSAPRERIPTPDERAALLAALARADRAVWTLALYAGLRAGELAGLRWSDVNLRAGLIRVERSWDPKSGTMVAPKSAKSRRSVPMLAPVREALRAHRLATGLRSGPVSLPSGAAQEAGRDARPGVRCHRTSRGAALLRLNAHRCGRPHTGRRALHGPRLARHHAEYVRARALGNRGRRRGEGRRLPRSGGRVTPMRHKCATRYGRDGSQRGSVGSCYLPPFAVGTAYSCWKRPNQAEGDGGSRTRE
jgi:integrase